MNSKLTILFAIFFALFVTSWEASVSAEPRAPLSGNYDIAHGDNDYTTISAAVADLHARGISDSVKFIIAGSASLDEQITINDFTRTGSPTDVVTFGNFSSGGGDWTKTGVTAANNYIIRIDGAHHITINYLDFEVDPAATTFGRIIVLENDAHNITINANSFVGISGATTNAASIIIADGEQTDNLSITNSDFTGGYRAIDLKGISAGNRSVDGLILENEINASTQTGIRARFQNQMTIEGNDIGDWIASDSSYVGINADGAGLEVTRNSVRLDYGQEGIRLQSGTTPRRLIANNMVIMSSLNTIAGINLDTLGVDVLHNSVLLDSNSSAGNAAALRINPAASSGTVDMLSNIFINKGGGYTIAVPDAARVGTSNYNDLYVPSGKLVRWGTFDYSKLSTYQVASGQDADSISKNVIFVNPNNDLHLGTGSTNDTDLQVPPLPAVVVDRDNEFRASALTYMGADEGNVGANEFVVTDGADTDDGDCTLAHCSLREAINKTGSTLGDNFIIRFAGPMDVVINNLMPVIYKTVTIDGIVGTGASCPTGNSPADLKVTLRGLSLDNFDGLSIGSDNTVVRGLRIADFGSSGINVSNDTNNARIVCNEIGFLDGLSRPNNSGVRIDGGSGHQIGGPLPADRNVISGNASSGIDVNSTSPSSVTIQNNYVGVAPDGTTPLGNGLNGITVDEHVDGAVIGLEGSGNRIAHNAQTGVLVESRFLQSAANVTIRFNEIHSNVLLGIDLLYSEQIDIKGHGTSPNDSGDADSGANGLQNHPHIDSVLSNGNLSGELLGINGATYTVDAYVNDSCDSASAGQNYGEGQTYLDTFSFTSSGGTTLFSETLNPAPAAGKFVSLTATDASGNTSEFGVCIEVQPATATAVGIAAQLSMDSNQWGAILLLLLTLSILTVGAISRRQSA